MSIEARRSAFEEALANVHVTAHTEPGFFDHVDDPIAALAHAQKELRAQAIDDLANSSVDPKHVAGLNEIVLHENHIDGSTGLKGKYVPDDSALHYQHNTPKVYTVLAHELGHHALNHRPLDQLPEDLSDEDLLSYTGRKEAEADHFSNQNALGTNNYVHAAIHHVNDSCTKSHGSWSHQFLKHIGSGYLDTMKEINPGLHQQLLNNTEIGNTP